MMRSMLMMMLLATPVVAGCNGKKKAAEAAEKARLAQEAADLAAKQAAERAAAEAALAAKKAAGQRQQAITAMVGNFQKVTFDSAKDGLNEAYKNALIANADLMKKHPSIMLEIQGHADERGTTDYNLALGDRRAASVRTFLSRQGISEKRITTVSFGEEKPAVRGHTESAFSQNRRAEFRVTDGQGAVGSVR